MKLAEIFLQLGSGELSQLSLGGDNGVIEPANYGKVIAHINLGLANLFTRFLLKEGRATVNLTPGIYTYLIDSDHVELSEIEDVLTGDVIKIERVYDAAGDELSLNMDSDPLTCRTPTLKTLWVPDGITGPLTVVYRASHPLITIPASGNLNPSRVEVELPYSHLEALLYFIASRVHNPIGIINEFHSGNSYAAKYEMACQQLEAKNIQVDQGSQYDRLNNNGWV